MCNKLVFILTLIGCIAVIYSCSNNNTNDNEDPGQGNIIPGDYRRISKIIRYKDDKTITKTFNYSRQGLLASITTDGRGIDTHVLYDGDKLECYYGRRGELNSFMYELENSRAIKVHEIQPNSVFPTIHYDMNYTDDKMTGFLMQEGDTIINGVHSQISKQKKDIIFTDGNLTECKWISRIGTETAIKKIIFEYGKTENRTWPDLFALMEGEALFSTVINNTWLLGIANTRCTHLPVKIVKRSEGANLVQEYLTYIAYVLDDSDYPVRIDFKTSKSISYLSEGKVAPEVKFREETKEESWYIEIIYE